MTSKLILAAFAFATSAIAQESIIRLHVLGGFGEVRSGCRVISFRNLDEPLPDGGYRDFANRFKGLEGVRIPYGRYEAFIRCADGLQGIREVQVSLPHSFAIVATNERKFRQHDTRPDLRIESVSKLPLDGVWWIRMMGVFIDSDLRTRFTPSTGVAVFYDPKPGRYMIMVHSDKGYFCSKLVDVFDAPRRWGFDPHACSFQFDERATLVTNLQP